MSDYEDDTFGEDYGFEEKMYGMSVRDFERVSFDRFRAYDRLRSDDDTFFEYANLAAQQNKIKLGPEFSELTKKITHIKYINPEAFVIAYSLTRGGTQLPRENEVAEFVKLKPVNILRYCRYVNLLHTKSE